MIYKCIMYVCIDGWESRIEGEGSLQKIIGSPKRIQRARAVGVQSSPGLTFAAPMQKANRARMEISAKATEVIPAEAMLVPAVIDGSNVAGEDKEKGGQRAQMVDSEPFLELHPVLDLGGVIPVAPALEIDDHDPRVEVAGPPIGERKRERRVGPEGWGEVGGEVGVAIFGCGQDQVFPQGRLCQLGNVVYEDEVGVQVNDASHAQREEVG